MKIEGKFIFKVAGTLTAISLVVALLLGLTNMLTADKIAAINKQKTEEALAKVVSAADCEFPPMEEIPQAMFDSETENLLRDYDNKLRSNGLSLDMYTQYTGTNLDTLKDSFKGNAERQVKIRLAMEKIAELEGVSVTMDEIDAEYKRLAGMYGLEEAKVREFIPASDVEQDLFITKAIDIVRNSADITVNKVKKSAKKKDEAEESEEK